MQRVQIGSLFMFSYISQELLEEMGKFQELLDEEETTDKEEIT